MGAAVLRRGAGFLPAADSPPRFGWHPRSPSGSTHRTDLGVHSGIMPTSRCVVLAPPCAPCPAEPYPRATRAKAVPRQVERRLCGAYIETLDVPQAMGMAMKEASDFGSRLLRTVGRFAFEFVIVFLGVYLAFVFTGYQEEKRKLEVRIKFYDALILELEVTSQLLAAEEQKIARLAAVVDQIDEGLQPDLVADHLSFVFPDWVAGSAFESQNFEFLDANTLLHITQSKPGLDYLGRRVDQFNALAASVLLPAQMAQDTRYYDADGKLLPQFAWYPETVRLISSLTRQGIEGIRERAIPDLQAFKADMESRL